MEIIFWNQKNSKIRLSFPVSQRALLFVGATLCFFEGSECVYWVNKIYFNALDYAS